MAKYTDEEQELKFNQFKERVERLLEGEEDDDAVESLTLDVEDAYAVGAISGQFYDELLDLLDDFK